MNLTGYSLERASETSTAMSGRSPGKWTSWKLSFSISYLGIDGRSWPISYMSTLFHASNQNLMDGGAYDLRTPAIQILFGFLG